MSTAIAAPEAILPGSDGRIHRFTAAGQSRCGLVQLPEWEQWIRQRPNTIDEREP